MILHELESLLVGLAVLANVRGRVIDVGRLGSVLGLILNSQVYLCYRECSVSRFLIQKQIVDRFPFG